MYFQPIGTSALCRVQGVAYVYVVFLCSNQLNHRTMLTHPLTALLSVAFTASIAYSTGHLISRKAGPGWISYLRMGAFYTKFSIITTPSFLSCL